MDRSERRQTRLNERLLLRAQRRLNRLMNLMATFQGNTQTSDQDPGEMEDMFTTNLSSFFTKGLLMNSPMITTTPNTQVMEQMTPTTASIGDSHDELCNDIRGRDRVCCNTAVTCFDDLTSTLDDLSSAKNDFSLMSACRVVGSELRKDKRCVSNALSRCSGPGRSLMQSRLDNRLDALYDQFYKHCRKNPFTPKKPTTTIQTHTVPSTTDGGLAPPVPSETPRTAITTNSGSRGSSGSSQTTNQHPSLAGSETPSEYSAVIAGALTGGVILVIILLIAAILWCRSRRENFGSDSSAGIIFYKPRHSPRPMQNNNNKPPLLRQESDHYAEIDERLVNPNMRPSLPPQLTNVGYINPVGDGNNVNYFQPEAYNGGAPMATTRGQLSYGAILASNHVSQPPGGASFYHSSPVIDRSSFNDSNFHNSETLLSPRRFMSQHRVESNPNSYVSSDPYDDTDQDDYEQPISANSSLRYSELNKNDTPDHIAPSPPINKVVREDKIQSSAPTPSKGSAESLLDSDQPIPSPRRAQKGISNEMEAAATNADDNKPRASELGKVQLGARDSVQSATSTKSSHHYFVLEPENDKMEYENSVSSPKLV